MAVASVEFIKKIPKIELHVHIEGTFSPELRLKLAKKHGISLRWATPEEAVADYKDSFYKKVRGEEEGGSLTFFDFYYGAMEALKTEDDFYELAMEYFTKAAEMNIRYSEVFFDPQAHTRRGIELDTVMRGLRRAQLDAQEQYKVSYEQNT
jgi:adenosine deaminase